MSRQIGVREPNYGLAFYEGIFEIKDGILLIYDEPDGCLKRVIKDFSSAWYL